VPNSIDIHFNHFKRAQCFILSVWVNLGGVNIEGEDDSYDFGSGAGFYVDATEEKWKAHYRMYSYVTKEVGTTFKKCFINLFTLFNFTVFINIIK